MPYAFLVTNTGGVTLTKVTVTDTLSAPAEAGDLGPITCGETSIANGSVTLLSGESITCVATYTVSQADCDHRSLPDVSTATGNTPGADHDDVPGVRADHPV